MVRDMQRSLLPVRKQLEVDVVVSRRLVEIPDAHLLAVKEVKGEVLEAVYGYTCIALGIGIDLVVLSVSSVEHLQRRA